MNPTLTPDWLLFAEQFPQFMKTYRRLAREKWFRDEGWTAFIAHYREGIFMQLYKLHWYNQEHEGIHLELALNARLLQRKEANLQLHVTHRNLLPDRARFNEVTAPAMRKLIEDLEEPFQFRQDRLSERVNVNFTFSRSNFAEKAADCIGKLRPLGDIVDDALFRLFSVGGTLAPGTRPPARKQWRKVIRQKT